MYNWEPEAIANNSENFPDQLLDDTTYNGDGAYVTCEGEVSKSPSLPHGGVDGHTHGILTAR